MSEHTERELMERAFSQILTPQQSAELSRLLIERFGSLTTVIESMSLTESASLAPESIRSLLAFVPHLHRIRILERLGAHPPLDSLTRATEYAAALYASVQYEQICLLCLDKNLHLTECCRINQGSLKEVPFYPRRLLQEALTRGARALILCHNHPSNWGFFSEPDVTATRELMELCHQNGIALLDHLLIARDRISSLRCRIYIPENLWRAAGVIVPPLAQWRDANEKSS